MATRYRGTDDEVSALNAFIALQRAADALNAKLAPRIREYGLTDSQFGVLEALYHLGPMHQNELGAKLLKSGGNMTLVIDNLEKRGFVRRVRSETDRRYITVHLTGNGEELIARVFPEHAAAIADLMSVISPEERETLRRLARAVGTGSPTEVGRI
ncbi:MAG TPA: MarR family transcriptional regulator [Firmicutes bacterium]|nr:MarR family transcriptional regulator [Bacillota bacterium]